MSATDILAVSQGCVGSPPTATGGQTNGVTGAQLKAWAQNGLGPGASILAGFFGVTIQGINLAATGDVAHFVLPGVTAFAPQLTTVWNASAPTGSVTWGLWSGPNATGIAVGNSATATSFGAGPGTATTNIAVTAFWVNGHDVYLNVSAANAVALTANVSLFYRHLA
jgi:hypothetical protein